MDWIKKRYDQFLLAVVAVVLLAFSIMIVLKTGSFGERFAEAQATVPIRTDIPRPDLTPIDEAKVALEKPPVWAVETKGQKTRGSLFVSELYIINDKTGVPEKPAKGSLRKDSLTGEDIPNPWFLDNNLPLLEADVALQDPDKDGFLNEDEWRAKPPTDPNNKDSHPPYYTKLFLKQFIQVPFRLIFSSYDGDPKKDKPEKMEFGINTVDLRQPTEFLKIGQTVPNTKFKLEKFEYKQKLNDKTGEQDDVSELTLMNTETGDSIVLILTKVTNSPDVYALFDYQWPHPRQDIRVKKLQEFALKPKVDERYKLVDVKETEAVIQLPDGQKYTVLRDPRKPAK
jgi:hypothetical protein